jgi:hypothetical protein
LQTAAAQLAKYWKHSSAGKPTTRHNAASHPSKGTNMWNAGLAAVSLSQAALVALLVCSFSFAQDTASTGKFRVIGEAPVYHPSYLRPIQPAKEKSTPVVDAKFVTMSALAMGLTIVDIEMTQHCLNNGTCRELNPLMPHSRAGMYAVNMPVNAAAMYLSYRLKASGHKSWWIAPIAISGAHAVGAGFTF